MWGQVRHSESHRRRVTAATAYKPRFDREERERERERRL